MTFAGKVIFKDWDSDGCIIFPWVVHPGNDLAPLLIDMPRNYPVVPPARPKRRGLGPEYTQGNELSCGT